MDIGDMNDKAYFRYSDFSNPFQKEVWETFGPIPQTGRLFELLADKSYSDRLPIAGKYINFYVTPELRETYKYETDLHGIIKRISRYGNDPLILIDYPPSLAPYPEYNRFYYWDLYY